MPLIRRKGEDWRERIAEETRAKHGIEMHGDIPAKKHKMAKKLKGYPMLGKRYKFAKGYGDNA